MNTNPFFLLRGLKSGELKIRENDNTTLVFCFEQNNMSIDIVDSSFLKTPQKRGFVSMLLKARDLAQLLRKFNLTIKVSHNKTDMIKLGSKASSGFSKAFTLSPYIQIMNFSEIRKLKRSLEN